MYLPLGSGNFVVQASQRDAKEDYVENVIIYACIHKMADASSSVSLQIQEGDLGDLIDRYPVFDPA